MKKLMIVLAAVAMATAVQAASVTWQYVSSVTTEDKWAGYTVYYFNTATFNAGKDASTSAINQSLLAQALDSSALYYASGSGTSRMYKTGTAANGPEFRQINGLSGSTLDWTMVLVNPAGSEYKVLGSGTANTYDPETQSATKANLTKTMTAMNNLTSYTVNVPEPTSGILMLVGLGALALRRRRA